MPDVFDNNKPIYLQIMDMVKKQIIAKEFLPGEKLPSVRDLSMQLEVNPNTVQRAYLELEREMLVFSKRGQGTFVVDEPQVAVNLGQDIVLEKVSAFIREMGEYGISRAELLMIIEEHMSK